MSRTITVGVSNQSKTLTDLEVQEMLPALQHQANYHFAPYWHIGARVLWFEKGATIPKGVTHLTFLDDSDQAGALGYHDVDQQLNPIAFVFAATDKQYGLSSSVTASHELLEALADQLCAQATQVDSKTFAATEVCDPTEDDSFGYEIEAGGNPPVLVSDFILPNWFIQGSPKKWDYKGHCSSPLEILIGGYMSYFVSGKGWISKQNFSGNLDEVPMEVDAFGFRTRPSQETRHAYAIFKQHSAGEAGEPSA